MGLFLLVFGVLALSGPGRIDIVDGQARFLVAQSIVDHGDPAVRDPDFSFTIRPGRDGRRYSVYRFPQSFAGAVAIVAADAAAPPSESRREFFFSGLGAVLGALLAVVYAFWFRGLGRSVPASIGWALAGVFCTPNWYYATSTVDDLLGALLAVAAVVAAWRWRTTKPLTGAALAGLTLGLAFNAKQPLALFALPILALLAVPAPRRIRFGATALFLSGFAIGLAAYYGYEWYKFPPGTTGDHARLNAEYLQPWPGDTLAGFCCLLLSPGAGMFWYCPPLPLGIAGLLRWRRIEPLFSVAFAVACGVFLLFVSSMSYFKGDLCWGPRYLTPVFALLWLFVPTAADAWPRGLTRLLLGSGVVVQLLALSVEPYRLYVQLGASSSFYAANEWVYFEPAISHLVNRPREIREILQDDGSSVTSFLPAPRPTSAPAALENMERGPEAVHKYRFLASLRPWWISQRWLSPADRPVPLHAAWFFAAVALTGWRLLRRALHKGPEAELDRGGP